MWDEEPCFRQGSKSPITQGYVFIIMLYGSTLKITNYKYNHASHQAYFKIKYKYSIRLNNVHWCHKWSPYLIFNGTSWNVQWTHVKCKCYKSTVGTIHFCNSSFYILSAVFKVGLGLGVPCVLPITCSQKDPAWISGTLFYEPNASSNDGAASNSNNIVLRMLFTLPRQQCWNIGPNHEQQRSYC